MMEKDINRLSELKFLFNGQLFLCFFILFFLLLLKTFSFCILDFKRKKLFKSNNCKTEKKCNWQTGFKDTVLEIRKSLLV